MWVLWRKAINVQGEQQMVISYHDLQKIRVIILPWRKPDIYESWIKKVDRTDVIIVFFDIVHHLKKHNKDAPYSEPIIHL